MLADPIHDGDVYGSHSGTLMIAETLADVREEHSKGGGIASGDLVEVGINGLLGFGGKFLVANDGGAFAVAGEAGASNAGGPFLGNCWRTWW